MTKKYCIFLSALFCAFLGVFLVANAVSPDRTFSQMENRNLEQLPVPSVKTLLNGQFMKDFETYTTDQFVGRDGWIALKSTTERVLGKKENNNVYFAAGDTLISRFDEPDGEKVTNNLNYVNNFVENVDIPVTFSLIPTQACIWADRLPAGAPNASQTAILEQAKAAVPGASWADLYTPLWEHKGEDIFYRTDHHWTPEAAFTAHQTLAQVLESDYGFTIPEENTDTAAFTRTNLSDFFLGSQGKRVGSLYAGVDDIEIWKPNFDTDFTYSIPIYDMERTGPFEESLLFPERIEEKDFFNGNPYTLYAGGDYPMARIYNELSPDRPRIMLLRDSYACVLTPFLALDCGELITIDLRYFHDDLLTYVDWLEPDLVIVMYTAGSAALDELFDFFPNDTAQPQYVLDPPAAEKPALGTN